jgi:hypothetical protein
MPHCLWDSFLPIFSKKFEVGEALNCMTSIVASPAHRAGQELHIHLVAAGLGADFFEPAVHKVDHGLFVPEPGIDLPAC